MPSYPSKCSPIVIIFYTTRIYGSLVHICTTGFQKNRLYLYYKTKDFNTSAQKCPKMKCEGWSVEGWNKSHKITNGSPKVGDKGVHSCSRPSFTPDRIWMGGGERTLLASGCVKNTDIPFCFPLRRKICSSYVSHKLLENLITSLRNATWRVPLHHSPRACVTTTL